MKNKIKVIRINNSVKYLVTAGITYRVGDTKLENLERIQGGPRHSVINNNLVYFCNLVNKHSSIHYSILPWTEKIATVNGAKR